MRYEMPVTVVTSSRYYGVRRTLRRSARTPAVIKRVREKLRRNPRRSVVKLAQEEGIGRTTMTDIVTKDLGCKPLHTKCKNDTSWTKRQKPKGLQGQDSLLAFTFHGNRSSCDLDSCLHQLCGQMRKCLQLRQNSINRTTGFTACARHPRRLEICRETTIPCKYHGLGMTQTH